MCIVYFTEKLLVTSAIRTNKKLILCSKFVIYTRITVEPL